MKDQNRCFVLETVKQDLSDCNEFGEVVYLFEFGEKRKSIFSVEYQEDLERRFKEMGFDPDNDFFVLTGFQITVSIAVAVLTKMFKNFSLLAFYTPTYSYAIINFGEVNEEQHKESIQDSKTSTH